MNDNIKLNAELRQKSGTNYSKALRRSGMIPGILYVRDGSENIQFHVNSRDFVKLYADKTIGAKIISLSIKNENEKEITRKAIIKDIQVHAIAELPTHIDLQEVVEGMKVRVAARVRPINVDKCPGIKLGGVLTLIKRSIKFNCHPDYIQPYIDIDLSTLQIGYSIHINDLQLTDKLVPTDKTNFPILMIAGRMEDASKDTPAQPASAPKAAKK